MENVHSPPPLPSSLPQNQGWEMARFCPLRGFILDLGDGDLLFYSILSKIVVWIVLDKSGDNFLLHLWVTRGPPSRKRRPKMRSLSGRLQDVDRIAGGLSRGEVGTHLLFVEIMYRMQFLGYNIINPCCF